MYLRTAGQDTDGLNLSLKQTYPTQRVRKSHVPYTEKLGITPTRFRYERGFYPQRMIFDCWTTLEGAFLTSADGTIFTCSRRTRHVLYIKSSLRQRTASLRESTSSNLVSRENSLPSGSDNLALCKYSSCLIKTRILANLKHRRTTHQPGRKSGQMRTTNWQGKKHCKQAILMKMAICWSDLQRLKSILLARAAIPTLSTLKTGPQTKRSRSYPPGTLCTIQTYSLHSVYSLDN